MAAQLSPSPILRFYGTDGKPLAGGFLITYDYVTSHQIATWANADMSALNPCQIQLDANGEPSQNGVPVKVFLEEGRRYKFRWFDSEMNPVGCAQPVQTASVHYGDNCVFNYYADVQGTDDEIEVTPSTDPETGIRSFFVGLASSVKQAIENLVSGLLAAKTEVLPGRNIDIDEDTAEDGHTVYTVNGVESVPNVEIISPEGTLDISEETDPQTNTKTFEIDVKKASGEDFWGHFLNAGQWKEVTTAETVLDTPQKVQGEGNISMPLPAGIYDFKIELAGCFEQQQISTTYQKYDLKIKYGNRELRAQSFLFDSSIPDFQTFWCGSVVKLEEPGNVTFTLRCMEQNGSMMAKVSHLFVHAIGGISGGGGGTEYSAGAGIDIDEDKISVKVKEGGGLAIDDDTNELEFDPDSDVGEVVEEVQKITEDLDKKLTVNFDMPGISAMFDFADSNVTTLSNGATMLCQAFTVPINNKIRVVAAGQEDATLLGIYAKQGYGSKIMLALYAFEFPDEEHPYGTTDYVGDTGPVSVASGLNQFPLKNINPNVAELESDKVYYACLYLPSQHSQGLLLAGCPGYGSNTVNAIPRFTVGVENIQNNGSEIDMNDPTSGLYYNDGNGNYYIGPWSGGYNERPSVPRFFLQIRNGEVAVPEETGPFDVVDNFTLKATSTVQTIFGNSLTPANSGMVFQAVTPKEDVSIKKWVVLDTNPNDYSRFGGDVYSSDFGTRLSSRDNCSVNVTQYGTIGGVTLYAHEYTPGTPVNLTANTTYRFPSCSVAGALSAVLVQYDTPAVEKTLHLFESAYNVNQWVQNYVRANDVQGPYLKVVDTDDNEYVI